MLIIINESQPTIILAKSMKITIATFIKHLPTQQLKLLPQATPANHFNPRSTSLSEDNLPNLTRSPAATEKSCNSTKATTQVNDRQVIIQSEPSSTATSASAQRSSLRNLMGEDLEHLLPSLSCKGLGKDQEPQVCGPQVAKWRMLLYGWHL
ncbi:hypothetical protein Y1Q_0018545 [Alligator mississippiensis]|uniref:Uncharacterized protein n=1 Tax=Alligator mississippiensis TaxID=8496 RepID=A0A151MYH0_ALLMI|nr:hypothetical protein Y1Q_0018545 [Alligator mississippiensis]